MEKYSFLLPAYKAEFLAEALVNIKNQTYTDFKCIVSDDCSPEGLYAIFNKIVGADSRFSYRRNKENMGRKNLVSHWNLLVDMCETEYLIMASDDDVYEPNYLQEIDKLVEKYPDIDLYRGSCRVFNGDGVLLNDISSHEYLSQDLYFNCCFLGFIACEANYCYRASTLKDVGGFVDFPMAWCTDTATHLMMSQKGCANTKDVVFNYRKSDISISNSGRDKYIFGEKLRATILYSEWIEEYVLNFKERNQLSQVQTAYDNCRRIIRNNIYGALFQCSNVVFFKLLRKSAQILDESIPYLLYLWLRKIIFQ